jgi:hypothetical protein
MIDRATAQPPPPSELGLSGIRFSGTVERRAMAVAEPVEERAVARNDDWRVVAAVAS